MCDYSLEMYASRAAKEGETLTTVRFPSGSIGLVGKGPMSETADNTCAVCVSYGTKLTLSNLPEELISDLNLSGPTQEGVTFVRIEEGLHHDAVRFPNERALLLHRLGVGVSVEFVKVADYANGTAIRPLPPELTAMLAEVEAPLRDEPVKVEAGE